MSPGDPDNRDDSGRPERNHPADVTAAFEDIVAGLRADGALPGWPEERPAVTHQPWLDPEVTQPAGHPVETPVDHPVEPLTAQTPVRDAEDDPVRGAEDDHFIPPDPPPLPPFGQAAAVGVVLLAIGLLLVMAPHLIGLSDAAGLPLGLLTLSGGLGWLVLRSWSSDPVGDGDGEDDGAVL